jgi:hypothetical protein
MAAAATSGPPGVTEAAHSRPYPPSVGEMDDTHFEATRSLFSFNRDYLLVYFIHSPPPLHSTSSQSSQADHLQQLAQILCALSSCSWLTPT